jgi:ATP-dependent DNA helicase PIF1
MDLFKKFGMSEEVLLKRRMMSRKRKGVLQQSVDQPIAKKQKANDVLTGKNVEETVVPEEMATERDLVKDENVHLDPVDVTLADLAEEQLAVVAHAKTGKSLYCGGRAGAGKSAIVNALCKVAAEEAANNPDKGTMRKLAPTGVAAQNIGGGTIHSFLGLSPRSMQYPVRANAAHLCKNKKLYDDIMKTSTMIIDEISLVSGPFLDFMSEILSIARRNPAPFGGIQVCIFGDFFQLPPVFKWEVKKGGPQKHGNDSIPFAFESKVWADMNLAVFTLELNHRQTDPELCRMMDDLRFGIKSKRVRTRLSACRGRTLTPPNGIRPLAIHTFNKRVNTINQRELRRLKGIEYTFTAMDHVRVAKATPKQTIKKSTQSLIWKADKELAMPELLLKIGAQVMLLRNMDVKAGLINGSTGIIVAINVHAKDISWSSTDRIKCPVSVSTTVKVAFDNGITVSLRPEMTDLECDLGSIGRTQFPLGLGWAVSSHKVQGRTVSWATTSLAHYEIWEAGQVYTIISRMRTMDQLSIEKLDFNGVFADPRILVHHRMPHAYMQCVRIWQNGWGDTASLFKNGNPIHPTRTLTAWCIRVLKRTKNKPLPSFCGMKINRPESTEITHTRHQTAGQDSVADTGWLTHLNLQPELNGAVHPFVSHVRVCNTHQICKKLQKHVIKKE